MTDLVTQPSESEERQMVTEEIMPAPLSDREAARKIRDWRRKRRRREYQKGRQNGGTRPASLLYAYASSISLGWPWDGIRRLRRAMLRRWK